MSLARAHSVPNVRAKVKHLTKQVSRAVVRQDSEILLPEEKLSLNDSNIDEGEFSWTIKIKSTNGDKKLERVLVVGPKGCRLYLPKSLQEIDDIPYTKMKEFSYNAQHHVFQISWQAQKQDNIEKIYFHTKNCVEIHEAIQKFIKDILREKNKNKDPDDVLARCTYVRRANLSELKKGGRHVTSSDEDSPQRKVVHDRSMSVQNSRTQSRPKKEVSENSSRRPKRITGDLGRIHVSKEKEEKLDTTEDEGVESISKSTPKKKREISISTPDSKYNSDSESSAEKIPMSHSAPHTRKKQPSPKVERSPPKKSKSPQKEKPKLIDIGEESSGSN